MGEHTPPPRRKRESERAYRARCDSDPRVVVTADGGRIKVAGEVSAAAVANGYRGARIENPREHDDEQGRHRGW
jgi:hypothetical protein